MGFFNFGKERPLAPPEVSEVKVRAQPITINPRIPNINLRQASRLFRLYQAKSPGTDVLDAIDVCKAKLRAGGNTRPPRTRTEADKLVKKLKGE